MSFWDGSQWVADAPPTPPPAKPEGRAKHVAKAVLEAGLISALTFGLIAGTTFAAKGGNGGGSSHAGSGGSTDTTLSTKDRGGGGGGKGGGGGRGGGGGGGTCTPGAPLVHVENTWAWGAWGSFGTAGQQLQFQVSVTNYDAGCGSSSFAVSVSAPGGFSVSVPASSVNLGSGQTAYLSAWVTSPADATDGDYAVVATASRSAGSASFTSYYKVYSSDAAGPTLYWPSPGDGASIPSGSYNIAVSARDDHAVKSVELTLDGNLVDSVSCDGIVYSCSLNHGWSASSGQHTARFSASDWMGNVSETTSTFTVN